MMLIVRMNNVDDYGGILVVVVEVTMLPTKRQ